MTGSIICNESIDLNVYSVVYVFEITKQKELKSN